MKRFAPFALAIVTLSLSAPAFGQSAPDRRGEVDSIVRSHPSMFGNDDTRREGLKVIVCALNPQDGGNWGRLTKLDQGGKIPADIIVWRPTREHFDVLTDTGPMWGPDGVLTNPAWQWSPVECGVPPPAPPPIVVVPPQPLPAPLPSVDYTELLHEILTSQRLLIDTQNQLLTISQDTNAKVANMDRTLSQTLGAFGKFAGKYLAPAIGGWYVAHMMNKDAPAAAPAK